MKDQFKRILDLVKRTGDTMIVTDSDGENAYVVMDLDQYELFIDAPFSKGKTAEDQLWEETDFVPDVQQETPEFSAETEPDAVIGHDMDGDGIPDIWDVMKSAQDAGPTWNPEQLSADELADLEHQYEEFAKRHVQDAIEESAQPDTPIEEITEASAPEVEAEKTPEKQDEDDFGEEQFYLEPID